MSAPAPGTRANGARPPPTAIELAAIAALREQLWDCGFRPVAVYSHDDPDPVRAGKAPLGNGWETRARRDPPEAATMPAVAWAMNTGVLCDGLRAIDVDIDNAELAGRVRALALEMLGDTIVRHRQNSGRCLLPYRAAIGEPKKIAVPGARGKIEVLGRGQQFVSHGTHPSGAPLYWSPDPPDVMARETLPAVTEEAILAFLEAAAPLYGGDLSRIRPAREPPPGGAHTGDGAADDIQDVIAALAAIPNTEATDWEHWNNVGMAAWVASGGSVHGLNSWIAWSAKHPTPGEEDDCHKRWRAYATCPPTQTGAGKLYRLAHEAMPGWRRPSETRARARGGQRFYDDDPGHQGDQEEPRERAEAPGPDGPLPGVADFLSLEAWLAREIPPPDRLLGDLITTTTRMFLVGRTGLGKTMLGVAMAGGMATGAGFLHWRAHRQARVLYIDGEMPSELIKARLADLVRRSGQTILPGNFIVFARDLEDQFAAHFPTLGKMPPLNTEDGHNFILALIAAIGGVDVIVFDNVMSLITGDHKDEIPWSETSPLVQALTARRIGQVWLDHTGHDTARQYGSSTKAWRFDSVGIMAALPDDQRELREVAFTLSFDHPGKARRRTPNNWDDYETHIIRLRDDVWTSEAVDKETDKRKEPKKPMQAGLKPYFEAFLDAITASKTPNQTTRAEWYNQCVRNGLVTEIAAEDTAKSRDMKQRLFRTNMSKLRAGEFIIVDGETIYLPLRTGEPW